jgi:NAD kinase
MVKTFHQTCPEVIFRNNPGEKSFLLLIYVLSDMKLFKEAMLTIADCLVSTTPTGSKCYSLSSP